MVINTKVKIKRGEMDYTVFNDLPNETKIKWEWERERVHNI